MTNVSNKQQRPGGPVGTARLFEGQQARDAQRAEQAAQGEGGIAEAATFQSDVEHALRLAADMGGVCVRVLLSRNRWERPCMMRQIAAYWLCKVRGYTHVEVGRAINRNRASVYHAIERIGGLLAIGDIQTAELWQEFKEKVNNYNPKQPQSMKENKKPNVVPEWVAKREYYASIMTNLLFEVADVLETLFVECQDAYEDCTFTFTKQQKNHMKLAHKHIKVMRSFTRVLPADAQEKFGDDAEIIADLIYATVSRTGTDDNIVRGFLEHIMQQPDKLGLDGIRKGGALFEEIKMRLAKARIDAKLNNNNNK